MKAWRIIRAILFLIFAVICLFVGYVDFKYGGWSEKAMYIAFIIGLILCLPRMVKDMASPYKGKREPQKFVRRRLLFAVASSAMLGIGIYFLLGLTPDARAVLESQMGVAGVWTALIFFAIFMTIYLIIELLVFYLPRRLGWDGEPESEEDEEKTNKTALISTVVIVLFALAVFLVAELVPDFNDLMSTDVLILVVALLATLGVYIYTRKQNKE